METIYYTFNEIKTTMIVTTLLPNPRPQTGKDKKYKCKAEQACLVTYTNRRACQFCRWIF